MKTIFYKKINKLVLETSLTLKDYKRIEKVNKSLLTLTDEEGEELFKIKVGETENISEYGIVFSKTTNEGNLYIEIDNVTEDKIQAALENLVAPISFLKIAEERVENTITEIEEAILNTQNEMEVVE